MSLIRPTLASALLSSALGALIAGGIAAPARAQSTFKQFGGAATGPVVSRPDAGIPKREPAPPALPGSRTQKIGAAPAQTPPSDMPPTEALFDAINRGDTAAARDAVNRGADLNGRNILGMSPMDLSVDLGRNDITFLLLSLRPAGGEDAGTPAIASSATPVAGARSGKASGSRAVQAAAAPPAPKPPRATVVAVPVTPAPRAPRQFAGDGGAPIPQMGFLGFGATSR